MAKVLIQVQQAKATLPDGRPLFEDVSFDVSAGDVVSLIGANGAGKSTILRMIIGNQQSESGQISINGRLGYMPQLLSSPGITVRLLLAETAGAKQGQLIKAIWEAEKQLQIDENNAQLAQNYATLINKWYEGGGSDIEEIWDICCQEVLDQPFDKVADRLLTTLSGGQGKRIALCSLLLGSFDVLLLDEPDNFLDIKSKNWLEAELKKAKQGILLVSHDRALLAHVSTKIVTIEAHSAWIHNGTYNTYETARSERLLQLMEHNRRLANERSKLQEDVEQLKRWAASSKSRRKQATAVEKRLQKFEQSNTEKTIARNETVKFNFSSTGSGKKVITLKKLSIMGLMKPFSTEVMLGERIALIGKNGVGKSHFMRLLSGDENVSHTGEIVMGARVNIGYFHQLHDRPNFSGKTPLEILLDNDIPMYKAMPLLARYGLAARKDVNFNSLSGGQQARLQLAIIESSGANLLLLDDPTDNLDVISAGELEHSLNDFNGTVICVSHDRWLLESSFDKYWNLKDNGYVEELTELPEGFL